MKIFSINPNSNKYFEDSDKYTSKANSMYQGVYRYTPIYPLYTFSSSGRFDYIGSENVIEFYTMLPISRFLNEYLVEVKFRFVINPFDKDSLLTVISEFNNFCEESKKSINVKGLVS